DYKVTGVQTCALPIFTSAHVKCLAPGDSNLWMDYPTWCKRCDENNDGKVTVLELKRCIPKGEATFQNRLYKDGKTRTTSMVTGRSEERRVGKEWRCRW